VIVDPEGHPWGGELSVDMKNHMMLSKVVEVSEMRWKSRLENAELGKMMLGIDIERKSSRNV
jgi:hypothetical protein